MTEPAHARRWRGRDRRSWTSVGAVLVWAVLAGAVLVGPRVLIGRATATGSAASPDPQPSCSVPSVATEGLPSVEKITVLRGGVGAGTAPAR